MARMSTALKNIRKNATEMGMESIFLNAGDYYQVSEEKESIFIPRGPSS
jgi:hypothetical protein